MALVLHSLSRDAVNNSCLKKQGDHPDVVYKFLKPENSEKKTKIV